jgi:DNA-binding MarR family transcriptional regulator
MKRKLDFTDNKKVAHLFGHYVTSTSRIMLRTLQQNFRKAGFTVTAEQWMVLVWLFDQDGRTQQELADLTWKDKPGITRIMKNLEKCNLITRMSHPVDGRAKAVFLTKEAKKMEPILLKIAADTQKQAIRGISETELEECRGLLKKISDNLQ